MEDDDSDTEMADYGTDFSDDVDPNFDAVFPGRQLDPDCPTLVVLQEEEEEQKVSAPSTPQ